MYELNRGTERLVYALYSAMDESSVKRLSNILHYDEKQLKDDIQALHDYYSKAESSDDIND